MRRFQALSGTVGPVVQKNASSISQFSASRPDHVAKRTHAECHIGHVQLYGLLTTH